MSVAFFDLDRTLLDVNSAHLWLLEEWRVGTVGLGTVSRAMWWFARYALGDAELDQAMEEAASIYAGVPVATLEGRIRDWFARDIQHRARPGALEAISRHRAAGDAVVLATTSSQFAAACAAELWGLDDAISTVVGSRDGLLDGTIASNAFGRHKLTRCAEWADARGIPLARATFYTDSFSDVPLLEKVGQPVAIHPDRKLARIARTRGWPIVLWGSAV